MRIRKTVTNTHELISRALSCLLLHARLWGVYEWFYSCLSESLAAAPREKAWESGRTTWRHVGGSYENCFHAQSLCELIL